MRSSGMEEKGGRWDKTSIASISVLKVDWRCLTLCRWDGERGGELTTVPEDGDIGDGSGEGEGKTTMCQVWIIISRKILCQSWKIRSRNPINRFIVTFLTVRSLDIWEKLLYLTKLRIFFQTNKVKSCFTQSVSKSFDFQRADLGDSDHPLTCLWDCDHPLTWWCASKCQSFQLQQQTECSAGSSCYQANDQIDLYTNYFLDALA